MDRIDNIKVPRSLPRPAAAADVAKVLAVICTRRPRKDIEPAGFQNSATRPDLGFYAARSYPLMKPPRTGRRWIRARERSATG